MMTREDGTVFSERRYEPFGQPIDNFEELVGGGTETGPIDFVAEPLNSLNKPTDPTTGFSYHGARWMASQTARWLTPDPIVKAPDPKFMAEPWALHPYQYVKQNPVLYWDPDGREERVVISEGNCGNPSAGNSCQPAQVMVLSDINNIPPEWSPGKISKSPLVQETAGSLYSEAGYKLGPKDAKLLGTIFKKHFAFDVSKVRFVFGETFGNQAFTHGNLITLNQDVWSELSAVERRELVTHEITHSAQFERLGNTSLINVSATRFLKRYLSEFQRPDNYDPPESLEKTPIEKLDLLDKRYTLDQIAERLSGEVRVKLESK